MKPLVSVVVITRNNGSTINKCIESLLNQTFKDYEIVFVDGHSEDGTDDVIKEYARRFSHLKLYYEEYGTMGYARNLGVSKVRGEIVAFTDGDAIAPEDWLSKLVDHFSRSEVIAVGGLDNLLSASQAVVILDHWRRLRKSIGISAIPKMRTVNLAVRREAFKVHGGFDLRLSHWDETEFLARLFSEKAGAVLYDPEIVVYHQRTSSVSLLRRMRKGFKKSLIGTPVLMRRYMMRIALANPTSNLGLSFFTVLTLLLGTPILLLSILQGCFVSFLKLGLFFYVLSLCFYLVEMFRRSRTFSIQIPLLLTIYFFTRLLGTFFGLLEWVRQLFFGVEENGKDWPSSL